MTPKEKAQELVEKMSNQTYQYQEYSGARYTTCEIGYRTGIAEGRAFNGLRQCSVSGRPFHFLKQQT